MGRLSVQTITFEIADDRCEVSWKFYDVGTINNFVETNAPKHFTLAGARRGTAQSVTVTLTFYYE